ncbi:MAG: hypothetical protein SGARI_007437, partial [Bacillariaceae sp.]
QGQVDEAERVFRRDLVLHPLNPWALVGLIAVLKKKGSKSSTDCCSGPNGCADEIAKLEAALKKQRSTGFADVDIKVACACCDQG